MLARGTTGRGRCRWWAAAIVTIAVGAAAQPVGAQDDDGDLIDVGDGRRMYLECHGEGGPTVVFESGYPNDGTVWFTGGVFQAVSGFTRACVYDRPGTIFLAEDHDGRSDPTAQPRTAADVVADLHALLQAAGEPGPYVFVAHSIGGLFARLYANTYPDDVAGLVLVDTTSEYQYERLLPLTPPQYVDSILLLSQNPGPEGLAAYPDLERILLVESSEQVKAGQAEHPLRPMPFVVLTHGIPPADEGGLPPDFPAAQWEEVIQELQQQMAQLVPGGQQVIAHEAGHYIHTEQPDLVIDATRAVVDAVRRGATQLAPSDLADTGGAVSILVTTASVLTVLGVALWAVARRGGIRTRRTA